MQELLAAVGPNAKRGIRSQITIHKAALKKGKLVADFSETLDNELAGRDFTVTCNDDAHPDLVAAFRALVPDFAYLTDQVPRVIFSDDEPTEQTVAATTLFSVTGITWKGGGDFVLSGTRALTSGHVLNLIAPLLTFDDVSARVPRLLAALNREVELGLRGKCAEAGRQLAMFQDDAQRVAALTGGAAPLLLAAGAEDVDYQNVRHDRGPAGGGAPLQPQANDEQPTTAAPEQQPKKRRQGRPRPQPQPQPTA